MPFVTQDKRDLIDIHGIAALTDPQPGDLCYVYYKPMVDVWKENPRWTTAHNIYKKMIIDLPLGSDHKAANLLAWQVFFAFHVVPYEKEAEKRNGTI